jgi:hypothetical protein
MLARGAAVGHDRSMDALREGQKVWVEQADGSRRAGIFVGEAEASWFGGAPGAYVAYPDTESGEEVPMVRVIPRDDDE